MANHPVKRVASAVLSLMFGYKVQQIVFSLLNSAASADTAVRRRSSMRLAGILRFLFCHGDNKASSVVHPISADITSLHVAFGLTENLGE